MKSQSNENVLLIGGHRKSGTTMLTRLFDGHEQIAVSPTDLNVLYAYYPEWSSKSYSEEERLQRLKRVAVDEFIRTSENDQRNIEFDSSLYERLLTEKLKKIDTTNIEDVVDSIVFAHRKSMQKKKDWLVVKETTSEVYAPFLLKSNKGWKFLHLVRDPRDNFAAIKAGLNKKYSKIGNDYIDTLGSVLMRYAYGIKWLRWNLSYFGLNRYYVIRFEDLLYNTSEQMKNLANWLGVQWDEKLLIPTYGEKTFAGNSHDGLVFNGVDNRNVGRWKERIDYDEAALIEFILQDEMDLLCYERETNACDGAVEAAKLYSNMNYKYFFADRFK